MALNSRRLFDVCRNFEFNDLLAQAPQFMKTIHKISRSEPLRFLLRPVQTLKPSSQIAAAECAVEQSRQAAYSRLTALQRWARALGELPGEVNVPCGCVGGIKFAC
jgi:hypothetical protein